jgi:hypothetical protein
MKNTINKYDFTFTLAGHGHYKVTYTSPATGKTWSKVTSNMPLIDATKNCDNPTKVNLNNLKWICKN